MLSKFVHLVASQGKTWSATSHIELKQVAHNQLCHMHYAARNKNGIGIGERKWFLL